MAAPSRESNHRLRELFFRWAGDRIGSVLLRRFVPRGSASRICASLVLLLLTLPSHAAALTPSGGSRQFHTNVIEGRLEEDDSILTGGEYVDVHKVEVTQAGPFEIRLTGNFDGYLIVQPPDYSQTGEGQVENDDWDGDLTESRVEIGNAGPGIWTVAVTTANTGVGGSYRLSLRLPGAGPRGGADGSAVRYESGKLTKKDSTLGGGEFYDQFALKLIAGESLVVSMESQAFDTYLILTDADANSLVQNDDFEDSISVSRVEYQVETTGSYLLLATSAAGGATGAYELTIEQTPPGGGRVSAQGERLTGVLKSGDETLDNGNYVDITQFSAVAGARFAVDLRSGDFDPYLFVVDSNGKMLEKNDDFEGDAAHSRVVFTVPAEGSYHVGVTSYGGGEGGYELVITPAVDSDPGDSVSTPAVVRTESGRLEPGDESLESGEFVDAFPVEVVAGESLVLELESSDFDAFLIVMPVDGDPVQQDDSDGSTNPVIEYASDATGTLNVVVTSARPGETGAYTLAIRHAGEVGEDQGLESLAGNLGDGDEALDSGEFYDIYESEMTEGVTYLISMSSTEFDTYVGVISPGGEVEADDGGGGDGDSFLEYVAGETGTHRITATSSGPGEEGSYVITIATRDLRGEESDSGTSTFTGEDVSSLSLGQPVQGTLAEGDETLDNGEFSDLWVFQATKGQVLSFEVSSTEFDTYMVLIDGEENVLQNDDIEGARDKSGIEWTAPSDGPVLVIVTSYRKGETGRYQLVATGSGRAAAMASISGRVYGVFVGISDYPGQDNDLPLCDKDAVRLQQALVDNTGMDPENGVVLINREARGDKVRETVREVRGRMQEGDMFIFFYSGHGSRVKRAELVPHDPDGHDALDEALVLYDGLLLDDELDTLLAEDEVGTTLIILDSCFSGGFSKDVISRPDRMGLFSSHEDVTSATAAKFKAGGFLAAFAAEALSSGRDIADENGDGVLDASELSQYIYEGYRNELVRAKSSDYLDVGDNLGYQQLIVDRGGVGVKQPLFRLD